MDKIEMKLGMQVGFLCTGHNVLYGTHVPSPKGAMPLPPISAHICCGKMAGWINMPLGMEVVFVPCDCVVHVDPATPFP